MSLMKLTDDSNATYFQVFIKLYLILIGKFFNFQNLALLKIKLFI